MSFSVILSLFLFLFLSLLSSSSLPSLHSHSSGSDSCIPAQDSGFSNADHGSPLSALNSIALSSPSLSVNTPLTVTITQSSYTINGLVLSAMDSQGNFIGSWSAVGASAGNLNNGNLHFLTTNSGQSQCGNSVQSVVGHSNLLGMTSISLDLHVTSAPNFPITLSSTVVTNGPRRDTSTLNVYESPSPPTNVNMTNILLNSFDVIFVAPTNAGQNAQGGSATITGYTVTVNPGNIIQTGTSSPIHVNGLSAGTTYSVTVTTTNSANYVSSPSSPVATAMTTIYASAPTNVNGVGSSYNNGLNGYIFLTWTAPATVAQGENIINYYINVEDNGGNTLFSILTNSTNTFFNITNGIAIGATYQCILSAIVTGNYMGAFSASSGLITPQINVNPPGPPTILSIVQSNVTYGQFLLSFLPGSNGNAGNQSFIITFIPVSGDTNNHITMATSSPVLITNLLLGAFYTFTIQPQNSAGKGPIVYYTLSPLYSGLISTGQYFAPDQFDGYNFHWTAYVDAGYIDMNITANVAGYVGWGVNEAFTMYGSDYVIGWVDDNTAEVYVIDCYADEDNYVLMDHLAFQIGGMDNIWNKVGWQNTVNDVVTTSIAFRRNITATRWDPLYDTDIINGNNVIFWATAGDDCVADTLQCQGHDNQGVIVLNLLSNGVNDGQPTGTAVGTYTSPDSLFTMTWTSLDCMITPIGSDITGPLAPCIEFDVTAPTTGWIGVSISNGRSMLGTDPDIAWWDNVMEVGYMVDTFGQDGDPCSDLGNGGTNDCQLMNMTQKEGVTHFVYRRYYVTGDTANDNMIIGHNSVVSWAYGYDNDTCTPPGTNLTTALLTSCQQNYHANQGVFQVDFLSNGPAMNAIAMAPVQGMTPIQDPADANIGTAMPIVYNDRVPPVIPNPPAITYPNKVIPGKWRYALADGTFAATWEFYTDNTTQIEYINVTIAANTNGWMAWGLCPTGNDQQDGPAQMVGCDYFIGWVDDEDFTPYILDSYDANDFPIRDIDMGGHDDLFNTWGNQDNGVTMLGFTRALVTADVGTSDLQFFTSGKYLTQYVYSTHDCDKNYFTCEYHSNQGNAYVDFNVTNSPALAIVPVVQPSGGGYTGPKGFVSTWVIDNINKIITITMSAPTSGWIALGVAEGNPTPASSMANNMDYWIGWVDDKGVAYVRDFNCANTVQPNNNERQDLSLISGSYVGGVTTIKFSRKLQTGDTNDNDINPNGQVIQAAYAPAPCNDDPAQTCNTPHTGIQTTSSINFYSGAVSALPQDPIWNAGSALCLGVALLLGAWATLRWGNKAVKAVKLAMSSEDDDMGNSNAAASSTGSTMKITVDAPAGKKGGEIELKEVTVDGESATGDEEGQFLSNPAAVLRKRVSIMAPHAATTSSPSEQRWRNEWLQLTTDDGYSYFYNEKTFETAWEIPPMPDYFDKHNRNRSAPHVRASMVGKQGEDVVLPTASQAMRKSIMTSSSPTRTSLAAPSTLTSARASIFSAFKQAQPAPRAPIKPVSPTAQKVQSILEYRLPYTQWSVISVVLVMVYIVMNAVCLFAVNATYFSAIELRFGYLAAGNLLIVILPAVRNSLLTMIWGLPFDRIIVFHRFIGRFLFGVVTLHMGLYIRTWSNQYSLTGLSVNYMLFHTTSGMYGFVTWCCMLALNISSLDYVRRKHFNLFYFAHFLFVPIYIYAYLHVTDPKYINVFIWMAVSLYAFDRVLRFIWSSIPFHTVRLLTKGDDVVQVRFEKHPLAKLLGLYKIGQYVFINFPCMGARDFFEWHPFTLSSGPDEPYGEVHIRGLGNFTKRLHNHVDKLHSPDSSPMWVRVDGPYGNHKLNYRRYPVLMLVAGGIGITPIVALVKDIYRVGVESNKKVKASSIESVYVVWIVPEQKVYNWFATEFDECWKAAQQPGMPLLSLWIYVTRGAASNGEGIQASPSAIIPSENFQFGRPDFDAITNIAVQQNPGKAQIVFSCGPEMMVNACWDASNVQKRNGVRMDFHHETFEW